ncbi:hypothetical protein CRUP_016980 [Coryphaenoides rupestris]|nr:hypothetical protein CRUP_016980 [Coryphaenoides rupestris]
MYVDGGSVCGLSCDTMLRSYRVFSARVQKGKKNLPSPAVCVNAAVAPGSVPLLSSTYVPRLHMGLLIVFQLCSNSVWSEREEEDDVRRGTLKRRPGAALVSEDHNHMHSLWPHVASPYSASSAITKKFPFVFEGLGAVQSAEQKCLKFNVDAPIWLSKQRILCTLNQSLKDVLNYGLFQPAYNGKAGKFLDEERPLREYPFPSIAPVPYLEFRYKRRVYTQTYLDDKQLSKLHTKGPWLLFTGFTALNVLACVIATDPHTQTVEEDVGEEQEDRQR